MREFVSVSSPGGWPPEPVRGTGRAPSPGAAMPGSTMPGRTMFDGAAPDGGVPGVAWPDGAAGAAPPADGSVDVLEIAAILRRRLALVLACLGAALALATAYVVLARPAYTATTLLLIDPRDRVPLGSDAQNLPQNPDAILIESQVKLLTSDAVLRRVLRDGALGPDAAPRSGGPLGGLLGTVLGMLRPPPAAPDAETALTAEVAALSRRVSAKRSERTYVIELEGTAPSAAGAAKLANAVARAYIDTAQDASDDVAERQTDFVKGRLTDLRGKVEAAEAQVQRYRAENGIVNASGTLVNEQQLADANRDLAAARARTAEARARDEQIRRILASGRAPETVSDALRSGVIERLRVQYADLVRQQASSRATLGPRHPALADIQGQLAAVRGQIGDELQRIAAAAANDVRAAQANEASAVAAVSSLKSLATATNQTLLRLRELEREADATRGAYERFLRARETIRRDIIDTPFARVVAPAVAPTRPSSPRVVPAYLAALAAGLALGVGLALLAELRAARGPTRGPARGPDRGPDRGSAHPVPPFRSGRRAGDGPAAGQAARATGATMPDAAMPDAATPGAPVLATIPHLASPGAMPGARPGVSLGRALLAYPREPASAFGDAVRALRDALLPASPGAGGARALLVASVGPGAGKSTLAVALAHAAADAGLAVLLVDANPDNPTLSRALGDPLTDRIVAVGNARAGRGSVHLLPIGPGARSTLPLAPTLRASLEAFDVVVVDGPACVDREALDRLAAGPDAFVLAVPAGAHDAAAVPSLVRGLPDKYRGTVVTPGGLADAARSADAAGVAA